MEGFGTGQPHPDPARLFFKIFKLISFKKLNRTNGVREILKPVSFIFDFFKIFFIFIFKIFSFLFLSY